MRLRLLALTGGVLAGVMTSACGPARATVLPQDAPSSTATEATPDPRRVVLVVGYAKKYPDDAFFLALRNNPDVTPAVERVQQPVLDESLSQWREDGTVRRGDWVDTIQVTVAAGLIEAEMNVEDVNSGDFVE